MKCQKCKEDFPGDCVSEMCINGRYINVCGVCALEIIRHEHRMPNYMFNGPQAKAIYDRALAAKKRKVKPQ